MICWRCLFYYTKATCNWKRIKGLKEKVRCCPKCECTVFIGDSNK